MDKIRCIIIEDEFPAVEILTTFLEKISDWEIVEVFDNALDAISFLSKNKVDVIFLDIQLPALNGVDFIKALENPPLIIITSAYNEHAVEAFELMVFDYLLKPYSFQRFIKTIARVTSHFKEDFKEEKEDKNNFIIVKENRQNIKIVIEDIIYIESLKEYIRIVCIDKEIKTKLGISKMEEQLNSFNIIRVHRSFMVSLPKISSYTKNQLTLNSQSIPIGKFYQKEVIKRIGIK